MPRFITKFRRNRWRDQVIANGQRLNAAYANLAVLDRRFEPDIAARLNDEIDKLARRRNSLLTKIKETA